MSGHIYLFKNISISPFLDKIVTYINIYWKAKRTKNVLSVEVSFCLRKCNTCTHIQIFSTHTYVSKYDNIHWVCLSHTVPNEVTFGRFFFWVHIKVRVFCQVLQRLLGNLYRVILCICIKHKHIFIYKWIYATNYIW